MVYSVPCFSGTCGLCVNCGSNYMNREKEYTDEEWLRRSSDLSKFLGKTRVERLTMDYNRELNHWCKKRGYNNPVDSGFAEDHIIVGNSKFSLIKNKHDIICSDSHCRVIYVSSHERINVTMYPTFPIYTNKERGISFCGPCLVRVPEPPSISKY